jgi:hypothetical protein
MDYILNILLRKEKFDSAVQDVVAKMNHGFSNLGNRLGGYLSIAGISLYVRSQIRLASSINDSAAKARVGTELFQAFKYAAEQNGSSVEDVSSALRALAINQTEAANKTGEHRLAFNRLGISINDLKSKRVDELFLMISQNIMNGTGSTQSFSDMLKVLGRNAESLFPAFREGFADAIQEAKDLKIIIADDIIQTLDEANDSFDRTIAQLNSDLIPALSTMLKILADSVWYWKTFAGAIGTFVENYPKNAEKTSLGPKGAMAQSMSTHGAVNDVQQAMEDYLAQQYEEKFKRDTEIENRRKKRREAVESILPGEFSPEPIKSDWKRPTADTLSKIGLFVGTLPSQRIAQQQLAQMKEMYWTMRDIKQMIDKKL